MNKEKFIIEVKKLGIIINNEKLEQLEEYYNFLTEYNNHTNITAITEEKEVYLKHFYDSLTIVKTINLNEKQSLIDIGTGAGFPGVILKIFFPHLKVTLLESNNKKTKFLNDLISKLSLENITVINQRAEEYALDHLNEFDICTARAVAYIDIICGLTIPFIKKDGVVLLMKGNSNEELNVIKEHQKELNIEKYHVEFFNLSDTNNNRLIISIRKKELTKTVLNYNQLLKRNKKWMHN